MKPIEAGCLAITIGLTLPESNGKAVRVLQCIGEHPFQPAKSPIGHRVKTVGWKVTPPIKTYCNTGQTVFAAENLLRIDGYEETEEEKRERRRPIT